MIVKGNKGSALMQKNPPKTKNLSVRIPQHLLIYKISHLNLEENHYCKLKIIDTAYIFSTKTFTSKLLNIQDYKFAESEEPQLLV